MSNPFPKLLVIAALMISLMIAISPARAVRYTVTDVDQTDLYSSTQAYKINDAGQIGGTGYLTTGENHVFQYDPVNLFTDLGNFAQVGQNAEGRSINSSGVVAGFQTLASGIFQALRWNVGNAGNSVDVFDALGGAGLESKAYGINGTGDVAGSSVTAAGPTHATIWSGTAGSGTFTSTDLDTLAGDTASTAYAVTDAGDATGEVTLASDETHAFLYSNGKMKDLGTLVNGHWSAGYDIAADDTVVGQSETTAGLLHAFIYPPNASAPQDLGPVYDSTGTPVVGNSSALGINTVTGVGTVVVGTADDASGNSQAAVWINGQGYFLADMINNNPGWTLTQATGINANGQIVGFGLLSSAVSQYSRAFRLDPVTPDIDSITLDPQGDTSLSVEGGTTQTGTVVLTDYAPGPDGVNVVIPPDALNQGVYSIVYDGVDPGVNGASFIHVPAGSTTANFTIMTDPVSMDTPITIQGSIDHAGATDPWAAASATPSATLTLTAPSVAAFTIEDVNKNVIDTIDSGDTIYLHVTLSQKAPDDGTDPLNPGFHVPVTCTNTAVPAPVSVLVPLGETEVWQPIATNSVDVVTAGDIELLLGAQVLDQLITVNPPQNVALLITNNNPNDAGLQAPQSDPGLAATGGAEAQQPATPSLLLGITLNGAAPAEGQAVTITTDDPSASVPDQTIIDPATGLPSCVVASGVATISAGYTGANIEIDTVPVIADTPVHFTASITTDQTYQAAYTLWVDAPTLTGFTIAPDTLTGGNTSVGTVTLSGPAADGLEIDIASYNPAATLVDHDTQLPITTVPITAGNTGTLTFDINTDQVTTDTPGLISVSLADNTLTQNLTVQAPQIASFVINDANGNQVTTVMGGKSQVFGAITLNAPAPAGGLTVTLTGDANAQANSTVNTANNNLPASDQSLLTPVSITIPEGVTTQTFTIDTTPVDSNATDMFSAQIQGAVEVTNANLQVLAPTISSVTLDQTVVSGTTLVTATVTLSGPVSNASNYTVDLSTSAPNTVSLEFRDISDNRERRQ